MKIVVPTNRERIKIMKIVVAAFLSVVAAAAAAQIDPIVTESTNTNTNTSTSTSTNTNINTSTSTNTNNNFNHNTGEQTFNNNNVNVNTSTSTSTNTNNNFNHQTGDMTNRNINTSTSTSTNTNNNNNHQTGDMTNRNINSNTSTNTNTNNNNNNNHQTGEMTNRNINETTQTIKQPPPTAVAPAVTIINNDVCAVGASAAVQTQIFGISMGGTFRDLNCERIKLSKNLFDMGMKVAAVATLCQDERVFAAMMAAGTPCPIDGKIGQQAREEWEARGVRVEDAEKTGFYSLSAPRNNSNCSYQGDDLIVQRRVCGTK